MLLSICIPCHNRTADLIRTLPTLAKFANECPPIEIVILDYASPDRLDAYIENVTKYEWAAPGNSLTYRRYEGRSYYHMAHARNLSVLASSGDYIIISSTDIYPKRSFFPIVRNMISRHNPVWMYAPPLDGVVIVKRDAFLQIGGYDERFEFYGPEDRELASRLERNFGKGFRLEHGLVECFKTPDEIKVRNYRLPLSKKAMHKAMVQILLENERVGLLKANPAGWGEW